MASFAKIGMNGKVIEVQSVNNEVLHDSNGVEQEVNGIDFLTKLTGWSIWKQTSYNGSIRKNYAGVGYKYDSAKDAFISPQPFASWTLNETTCTWESPVPMPTDGIYNWDDANQQWVLARVYVDPSE